jgi:hypothetical protein
MTKFIKVTEIVIAVCVLTILVLVIKDIVTKEIREYLVAIAGVAIFYRVRRHTGRALRLKQQQPVQRRHF